MSKPVSQYRQDLHLIPELGFELPKTLAYVKDHLQKLNGVVIEPAPSSVCIYFDNGQPTTLAFRADMDGLPVTESPTHSLRSAHEGQMHACGHDGHMSMLLSFCDYVSSLQGTESIAGHNVLAIFQPAEETTGGAAPICESGIFEKYNVDTVFGIHMWPGFSAGEIVSRRSELMARCSEVTINVTGRSVHIAKANEGNDALYAATTLVNRLYQMVEDIPVSKHRLLKFGELHAGTVGNIIAGSAYIAGSMRAFNNDIYQQMREGLDQIVAEVSAETGCQIEVSFSLGYPPVINDGPLFDAVSTHIDLPITLLPEPPMTGEDFSFYQERVPGVFFFLGTGHEDALHSQTFQLEEEGLQQGVELYKQLLQLQLPASLK